jgi:hypothetical protein
MDSDCDNNDCNLFEVRKIEICGKINNTKSKSLSFKKNKSDAIKYLCEVFEKEKKYEPYFKSDDRLEIYERVKGYLYNYKQLKFVYEIEKIIMT